LELEALKEFKFSLMSYIRLEPTIG